MSSWTRLPEARVTVFYMDVRAFTKGGEEFYDRARARGVRYRRGNPSEVYRRGDKLVVRAEDTLLRRTVEVEADLVVLAVGLEPGASGTEVSQILKLSRTGDGFLAEAHPKLRPVDTTSDGVFLAGTCQGPKDIPDTVAQAKAAASSALIPLSRGTAKVEAITSSIIPGAVRRLRPVRGGVRLRRAEPASLARGDDGQRGAVQGLRRLRGGLPVQGDHPGPLYPEADAGDAGCDARLDGLALANPSRFYFEEGL